MNYLSVEKLSKSYHEKPLFNDITFGIDQGQKVALVGKNGSGKSTLLRIIAGAESPDSGRVIFRKGIRVGYLPQNPDFGRHLTIRDYIFSIDNELLATISAYEAFLENHQNDLSGREYVQLVIKMDALGAWEYEAQIKQILGKLGLHDLGAYTDELSGGQRKRVALAAMLVSKPDFLILDEPTNHLDIEVIEWLEKHLSTQNLSLLLVTHDRYFLEEITNEIIEIDNTGLYTYKGNYSFYLEKKAERKAKENAEIAKAKNLLVKELDWLKRMPRARGTKAKYRVDAVHELMEKADKSIEEDAMTLRVSTRRQGKKILELYDISLSFNGEKFIDRFSYTFKKRDRIGVVGKNGVGKTTLLNIITGDLMPDHGEVVIGETTHFGYYRQEPPNWPEDMKVIDVVKEVAEVIKLADGAYISAAQFLNHFLFPHDMHHTPVSKLSGGEKRRLQLLRVLIKAPNFLILDEPTNDLDILTLNVLEDYLLAFEGTIMIVSHDRYFMDKLTNHLFVFEGKGMIHDFPGNYSDYKNHRVKQAGQRIKKERKTDTVIKQPEAKTIRQKLTYKEMRELESLEVEIGELEEKKQELLAQMNAGSQGHEELMKLSRELEQLAETMEAKENRWLELSERL